MSPERPIQQPRRRVSPGAAARAGAPTGTRSPSWARSRSRSSAWARARAGFTLIELMVAIMIGAVMLFVAMPAVFHALHRDPLTQAILDLEEGCREARARAVLGGRPMQLVISGGGLELRIEPAPRLSVSGNWAMDTAAAAEGGDPEGNGRTFSEWHRSISPEITFRVLQVNLRDLWKSQADSAYVRFHPNGTCDQLDAELDWRGNGWRRLTLEVTTSLPTVVASR